MNSHTEDRSYLTKIYLVSEMLVKKLPHFIFILKTDTLQHGPNQTGPA